MNPRSEFTISEKPVVRAYKLQTGDIFCIPYKTFLKCAFKTNVIPISVKIKWLPIFKWKILRWLKKPMKFVELEWIGK